MPETTAAAPPAAAAMMRDPRGPRAEDPAADAMGEADPGPEAGAARVDCGGFARAAAFTVMLDDTVRDARRRIKAAAADNPSLFQRDVFVLDAYSHLVGRLKVTDLLGVRRDRPVRAVMDPSVVALRTFDPVHKAAVVFREHGLNEVPLVDTYLRFAGVLTLDRLLEIQDAEHERELSRLTGVVREEGPSPTILRTVRLRTPWLLFGLCGEFVAAMVMSRYESGLGTFPQAAYFIPLIAALGGNTGIQASSVLIRELSKGPLPPAAAVRRLWREVRINWLVGLICAAALMGLSLTVMGDARLGLATAASLLIVMTMAVGVGVTVPILLDHFEIDPAISTGPFITTANDILGIAIYLTIALWFLGAF